MMMIRLTEGADDEDDYDHYDDACWLPALIFFSEAKSSVVASDIQGWVGTGLGLIMCICASFKLPLSQIRQIGAKAKLSKSSDAAEPVYLQEGLRIRGKKSWV